MKPPKKPDYLKIVAPADQKDQVLRDETEVYRPNLLSNAVPVVVRQVEPPLEPKSSKFPLYLSIMKPITWVPVVWSFLCGAVGAGGFRWELNSFVCLGVGLLLSGPLLCGMGQAINDYFDREVDAVNEPWRAIPSGRMTLLEVYRVIAVLGFAGLAAAYYLGQTVLVLSFIGIAMAHAYSAPPIRFKRFTWLGPMSSAVSYIVLPWLAAASIFGGITWRTVAITFIFALGGIGIMISNDFKSIRGDFALKIPSVPVVFGTKRAAQIACGLMDGAQVAVIAFLFGEGRWVAATVIILLLIPQLILQRKFIEKPLARAIWYNARGQNFFVLGMLLASCLAL
jgi:chlorophyll/bacteriochlorophyll a synthase